MDKSGQKILKKNLQKYPIRRYKKRESIIRDGDSFTKFFYISAGYVRHYFAAKNGKEINLHLYKPEDIFPTILTIRNTTSRYYFEALTPVEVYAIPKEEFMTFVKKHPNILDALVAYAGDAIHTSLEHLETVATESSYNNVASVLSYLSTILAPIGKTNGKTMEIPLSHQEIASWTNTTRETVSRQIQKLTRRGIVKSTHRHIMITDIAKLRKEIQ